MQRGRECGTGTPRKAACGGGARDTELEHVDLSGGMGGWEGEGVSAALGPAKRERPEGREWRDEWRRRRRRRASHRRKKRKTERKPKDLRFSKRADQAVGFFRYYQQRGQGFEAGGRATEGRRHINEGEGESGHVAPQPPGQATVSC